MQLPDPSLPWPIPLAAVALRHDFSAGGNGWPGVAVSDLDDHLVGDAGHDRNCVRRDALSKKPADVDDALARQLGHRIGFSAQVDKTRLPLMLGVPGEADPLQVAGRVVQLVAVDVVDGQAISVAIDKGASYQSMHALLDALPALHHGHLCVAALFNIGRDSALRKTAGEDLSLPGSCPLVCRCVLGRKDGAVGMNDPLDAFGLNALRACLTSH